MDADYWTSYTNLSSRLRKRFLRKPNYGEAARQFQELTTELQRAGNNASAAFCALAVARCEEALGNQSEHAKYSYTAAQLYMSTVHYDATSAHVTLANHITDATNTYLLAVESYMKMKRPALASTLLLELATSLESLGLYGEAVIYYNKAALMQQHAPLAAVTTLRRCAMCRIRLNDFDGAFMTLTELVALATEAAAAAAKVCAFETGSDGVTSGGRTYEDVQLDANVTRILLLMLIQPPKEHANRHFASVVQSIEERGKGIRGMDPVVFQLLQSAWTARQENDWEALKMLCDQLYVHLTPEQNDLVFILLQGGYGAPHVT